MTATASAYDARSPHPITALAPLFTWDATEGRHVSFIGADISDYLDFLIDPAFSPEAGALLLDHLAADVDRHVSGRMYGFEQDRSLGLRTGAELDDDRAFRNARGDLRHDRIEDRRLGSRRIIRGKAGNFVE